MLYNFIKGKRVKCEDSHTNNSIEMHINILKLLLDSMPINSNSSDSWRLMYQAIIRYNVNENSQDYSSRLMVLSPASGIRLPEGGSVLSPVTFRGHGVQ